MVVPSILKSEERLALAKINRNKAAGLYGITIKIISALDDFGIDKITEILNELYGSSKIADRSREIFIEEARCK